MNYKDKLLDRAVGKETITAYREPERLAISGYNDMDDIIINIFKSSNGDGYYYDIYNNEDIQDFELDQDMSIDGGFCTTSLENTLGMITEQLKNLNK